MNMTAAIEALTGKALAESTDQEIYLALLDIVREQSAARVKPVKGRKLFWNPVDGARGYIISRSGKVVAITTKTQFIAEAKAEGYTVQTVGATGNISRQIDE